MRAPTWAGETSPKRISNKTSQVTETMSRTLRESLRPSVLTNHMRDAQSEPLRDFVLAQRVTPDDSLAVFNFQSIDCPLRIR